MTLYLPKLSFNANAVVNGRFVKCILFKLVKQPGYVRIVEREINIMDTKTHHLIIKPQSAATACGKVIIAYYPLSNTAMLEEAGQEPIKVTVGKTFNCQECKERVDKL